MRGNSAQFVEQAIGVLATAVYSVIVTWVLLKVVQAIVGLRVSADVEQDGLDSSLHGERGYVLGSAGSSGTADASE